MAAPVRGWTSKNGAGVARCGPPAPSRCPFSGLGKGQAAQVVRRLGRPAAGCKERPFVGLQKLDPLGDIARASDVPVKAKFCAKERGAQLRDQFLRGVIARAEPVLQIPIETGLVPRPMR